jgi:hypothetical protein
MGLSIDGWYSEKEWSYSYTPLHWVRYLACKIDGYKGTWLEFDGPFRGHESQQPWLKHKRFWQLLHFSDCEGILLPDSRLEDVDYENSFEVGSSTKLLRELDIIREEITTYPDKYKDMEQTIKIFWDLYNLVKDEVDEGAGILRFH